MLLCAHGVSGGPGVAERHAAAIRNAGSSAEVSACCLHGNPSLEDRLSQIEAPHIRLMPLLMAEGFSHAKMADLAASCARELGKSISVAPALGTAPALGRLIETRAIQAATKRNWRPQETGLLLVGHGTRRNAESAESLRLQTAGIAARGGFGEVRHALIEADPLPHAVLNTFSATKLIAVGFFLDGGIHGEIDVPACLSGFAGEAVYTGPIGNDPGIPPLILDLLETRSRAVA